MAVITGKAGNDTITGTIDPDTIRGLAGNDRITGGTGNDFVLMGAGNDTFIWVAGDGDDTLRGGDGFDTLGFEASNNADSITIAQNGSRVGVSETGGDALDLDDIERIFVRALAGADGIFIDNLALTDVKQVVVDLAAAPGDTSGDNAADNVMRNGGAGNDILNVALVSGAVSITGPSAEVTIRNADASDILEISGLAGNDAINASKLPANVMRLSLDGGIGNDTITGSQGNDLLLGDDGNDVVGGGRGNDFVDLGTGNDLFAWSVGDGKDTVNGGNGIDRLLITGSRGANFFSIFDNAGTTFIDSKLSGLITVDGVERIGVRGLAGADHIEIGDMTQSDVSAIDIDFAATPGGTAPDGAVDLVAIFDFDFGDIVEVTWSNNKIAVTGLSATVSIANAGANDQLNLFLMNNNIVDASSLPAGKVSLLFSTSGSDTIFGSGGNDTVLCGPIGDVTAYLGAGNDFFDGRDGNDVVQMGSGNDKAFGGAGNDIAYLDSGNDTFTGYLGNDVAHMGVGNDLFDGGEGNDIGFLGAGNDTMNGGAGNDAAYLGAGNDRYNWRIGGNDTVHGGDGIDTFDYRDPSGPTVGDVFSIQAAASGAQFSRISGEVISLSDVERVRVFVGGGGDYITANDLAGTGVKLLAIDLAASVGSAVGDGEVDIVDVRGTASNDLVTVTTVTGGVSVTGLQAQVTLVHADGSDYLYLSGGDGNDTINASAMSDVLNPEIAGGNGNDFISGGACTDRIDGQDGNDTLSGGAAYDLLHGGVGNDRLFGGTSADDLYGDSDNDYLDGGTGNDYLNGDLGNDVLIGGRGNDFIRCGDGADRMKYTSVLDGHDVILDFDGDPTGGQDVLDLDALFDSLGIAASKRAALVNINDLGGTVEVSVNADGKSGFELLIATLNTVDAITKGQDVIVGT